MSSVVESTRSDHTAVAAPELLAPAGDWEAMRAAVANGANAVYFGLGQFNARHRATNFRMEELPDIMTYLHDHNVKGFLTFNTLIFSDELPDAVEYIRAIASAGVDAVIVQDLGLARLIRAMCPTLPIHGSTQMTLTEPRGIEFVRRLGVERVVVARELSVADIGKIRGGTDMPLEVFIHGALCVAYSGQCLTSESLGGRSANRGQCAQACRLPYELIVDGEVRDLGDKSYLLSPQDLAAYDLVDDLARLGVASLKIEGRLKSAHYVAATTQTYRHALDATRRGQQFRITPDQRADLEQTFSRGFTHGFLDGVNHQELVAARFPKSRGRRIGTVERITPRGVLIALDPPLRTQNSTFRTPLSPGDGVVFDEGHPEQDEQGGRIFTSHMRDVRHIEIELGRGDVNLAAISVGAIVWKTDDPAIRKRLEHSFARDTVVDRVPVDVSVRAHVGEMLTLTFTCDGHEATVTWDKPLERANKFPISEQVLREQLGRLGDTPFELRELRTDVLGDPMVPKSVLNDLRRQAVEQLTRARHRAHPITNARALDELRLLPLSLRERLGEGDFEASQTPVEPTRANRHPERSEGPRERDRLPHSEILRSAQDDEQRVWVMPSVTTARTHPHPALSRGESETGDASSSRESTRRDPALYVLVRTLDQLDAALAWRGALRPAMVYCDFEDVRRYGDAVARCRAAEMPVALATLRVVKPGEEGFLRQVSNANPDALLVRNLAAVEFYREIAPHLPQIGDYSLNVANELTAQIFAEANLVRMVPSYDLNWSQLAAMLRRFPAHLFEAVVHQHMPMFHMEHCVFSHTMSTGKDYRDCGRPCERHQVDVRDRVGEPHPLIPDIGCRNTVFNAQAQSAAEFIPRMRELGIVHYRVELLRERKEDVAPLLSRYADVLTARTDPRTTLRSLRVLNQLGVTRGTLEHE